MLGPFATASRRTPIHQVSLPVLSHAACASISTTTTTTTTTTTRDRGDRYGPMEWAQLSTDAGYRSATSVFVCDRTCVVSSEKKSVAVLPVPAVTTAPMGRRNCLCRVALTLCDRHIHVWHAGSLSGVGATSTNCYIRFLHLFIFTSGGHCNFTPILEVFWGENSGKRTLSAFLFLYELRMQ